MKKPYSLPRDLYYTNDHEWVKIADDKTVIVGLTDYAFEGTTGLGSRTILFIELPAVGRRVARGESIATIETEKNISEVSAPLSGEILEVNQRLPEDPTLVGMDPYGRGWIVKLKIEDTKQIEELMNPEEYIEYIGKLAQ